MSNPTRLLLFLGLLLVVALSCLDLCSASFGTTLKLKPIAPLRMFDKQKRHDIDETPLLDSRVYQPYQRRDTVPIGGGIGTLGTYYTEIKVAGQPFRVIVDTGSSVLYVPGTNCVLKGGPNSGEQCFSFNTPLSPSNSNLSSLNCDSTGCSCNSDQKCFVATTFGDGSSVQGIGFDTTISVGNLTTRNGSFALADQSSAGFVNDEGTSLDGLWGLGYQVYPGNSLIVIKPVLDSLFASNPSVDEIFSLDLELEGGTLSIGSVNSAMVTNSTLHWTRIIAHGWYVINNPQFAVGTGPNTLGSGNGGQTTNADTSGLSTIVDSGATLFVLPLPYWSALQKAMEDVVGCDVKYMCGTNSVWQRDRAPLCYTDFPLSQWPTIAVLLPSIGEVMGPSVSPSIFLNATTPAPSGETTMKLVMSPSQYMIHSTDVQGRSCLAFGFDLSEADFMILGDTFLTHFYTIFDRKNDRIGFVPKASPGEPIAPQAPLAPSGVLGSGVAPNLNPASCVPSMALLLIALFLF